jgi:hypothetical protein
VNGYVTDKLDAPAPQATSSRLQLLSVPIKGNHGRTFIKEAPYDGQTDPLGRASYNDALPTELRHVRLLGMLVC